MSATDLDRIVSRLVPEAFRAALTSQSPEDAQRALMVTLDYVYSAVSTSSLPLIVRLADANASPADRRSARERLSKTVSATALQQQAAAEGSLRAQLKAAQDRADSAEKRVEELEGQVVELELLSAGPDTASVRKDDDGDGDGSDTDDADDWEETSLTDPSVLYATRVAWQIARQQLAKFQRQGPVDAEAFATRLAIEQFLDPAARATLRLLQNTAFDLDWIDPMLGGAPTPNDVRALLAEASLVAREPRFAQLQVSQVVREAAMRHVVYSAEQWPGVVTALAVYHSEHWGATPLEFMRWLNESDDARRKQLLALLSTGDLPPESLRAAVPSERAQAYLEELLDQAANQLERNAYNFVPVERGRLMATLGDLLTPLVSEVPALQKRLAELEAKSENLPADAPARAAVLLELSEGFQESKRRVERLYAQLPRDYFARLGPEQLAALFGAATSVNDAQTQRALVAAFDKILDEVSTEPRKSIAWVL